MTVTFKTKITLQCGSRLCGLGSLPKRPTLTMAQVWDGPLLQERGSLFPNREYFSQEWVFLVQKKCKEMRGCGGRASHPPQTSDHGDALRATVEVGGGAAPEDFEPRPGVAAAAATVCPRETAPNS